MGKLNGRISRRTVLRGAGAMLALPFLEAMTPLRLLAGETAGKPPLRMGIFSTAGGTVLESWKPKDKGTLGKLTSILRPLEPVKNEVLVLSGLSQGGRSENLNAHEHCSLVHLTGASFVKKEPSGRMVAAESVDQAVARVTGEQTLLPSIEVGLNLNQYSFRGPSEPAPSEANPRLVFERMFRGRKPVVPNWSRRATATVSEVRQTAKPDSDEQSVVDLVLAESKSLQNKLGAGDKRKLDEYVDSVRSIEKRIAFVESRHRQEAMDALNPGPSKLTLPSNLPAEGLPVWKVTQPIERDPERHAEYIRLLADLLILAFQTDTTRVATLAVGSDEALFPGVVTVGYERHCHTLEHQGNAGRPEDADPIAREACRQIHAWYTMLFAEMIQKMKQIDEGGSSLLDNSMILYTSYMADGGHGTRDYPVLLAGRCGGSLKPGRHIAYKAETPAANLYVEMLNRMGVKTDEFGNSRTAEKAAYDGRLPGLV
jgi:hypothetical protein